MCNEMQRERREVKVASGARLCLVENLNVLKCIKLEEESHSLRLRDLKRSQTDRRMTVIKVQMLLSSVNYPPQLFRRPAVVLPLAGRCKSLRLQLF